MKLFTLDEKASDLVFEQVNREDSFVKNFNFTGGFQKSHQLHILQSFIKQQKLFWVWCSFDTTFSAKLWQDI